MANIEYQINKDVRYKEVQLIGDDGSNLGIMSSKAAYYKAKDADLDLVCINPNANIPVCKILDYGKFKYSQQKKAKEARKNQHNTETHEVQIKFNIQTHDLQIKANTIERLMEHGDDVRIVLRFRGREEDYEDIGRTKVEALVGMCAEFAETRKELYREGRDLITVLKKKK